MALDLPPLTIARNADATFDMLPALANRHGLITGATGTGKTVTLQTLAEKFSQIGVPVFMADVKGDLAGIAEPGRIGEKLRAVLESRGIVPPEPTARPVTFWDVFGQSGHPVRATVSDLGPLLLGRMLDLKDLRAMLQHVADQAAEYKTSYGNVSAASVGAIQRGLLQIESQGGDRFFGEPMLDIQDLLQTSEGRGVVNLLAADKLMQSPRLYATFLLWLLSELFEQLPEIGDPDKPKLVFFFDEAHLLFDGAPKVLVERIELVVRLVRSKGVGVYFVTQNPLDIPDSVLAQLGNRVQHALRAFTPRDQKAVRATAQTMRQKPGLDIEAAITELQVGEALISLLDAQGRPSMTDRAFVVPPASLLGPIAPERRAQLMAQSLVANVYEKTVDRLSAYEMLRDRTATAAQPMPGTTGAAGKTEDGGLMGGLHDVLFGTTGPRGGRHDGLAQSMAKSAVRTMGTTVGREIIRGVLGSLFGGRKR